MGEKRIQPHADISSEQKTKQKNIVGTSSLVKTIYTNKEEKKFFEGLGL